MGSTLNGERGQHKLQGDMDDSHVGLQARLMSQALRKLTRSINRKTLIVADLIFNFELVRPPRHHRARTHLPLDRGDRLWPRGTIERRRRNG